MEEVGSENESEADAEDDPEEKEEKNFESKNRFESFQDQDNNPNKPVFHKNSNALAVTLAEILKKMMKLESGQEKLEQMAAQQTSNDTIAGNGRVLKFDLFIVWLYVTDMSVDR